VHRPIKALSSSHTARVKRASVLRAPPLASTPGQAASRTRPFYEGMTTPNDFMEGATSANYIAHQPPSTGSTVPVTKEEASEARNSATPTTSSTRPRLRIGVMRQIACSISGSRS